MDVHDRRQDTPSDIDRDVMEVIDMLLIDGKYAAVDQWLRKWLTQDHSLEFCLAALTITLAAKSKLANRAAYYADAIRRFPNDVDCFHGLE